MVQNLCLTGKEKLNQKSVVKTLKPRRWHSDPQTPPTATKRSVPGCTPASIPGAPRYVEGALPRAAHGFAEHLELRQCTRRRARIFDSATWWATSRRRNHARTDRPSTRPARGLLDTSIYNPAAPLAIPRRITAGEPRRCGANLRHLALLGGALPLPSVPCTNSRTGHLAV